MTVGLLGATGTLEIDAMTFDLVPKGGEATANLVLNGDFELGTPEPFGWLVEQGARRVFPGLRSDSALELTRSGARAARALRAGRAVHGAGRDGRGPGARPPGLGRGRGPHALLR